MTLAVRPTTRDEDWRYADAGQLEVLEPAALDAWHDTTLAPGEVRGKDLILDDAHPGIHRVRLHVGAGDVLLVLAARRVAAIGAGGEHESAPHAVDSGEATARA